MIGFYEKYGLAIINCIGVINATARYTGLAARLKGRAGRLGNMCGDFVPKRHL